MESQAAEHFKLLHPLLWRIWVQFCENWWSLGVHSTSNHAKFHPRTDTQEGESIAKCSRGSSSLQTGHLGITCLHWKPPRKKCFKITIKTFRENVKISHWNEKACSSSSYGLRPPKSVKYSRRSSWKVWTSNNLGRRSVVQHEGTAPLHFFFGRCLLTFAVPGAPVYRCIRSGFALMWSSSVRHSELAVAA